MSEKFDLGVGKAGIRTIMERVGDGETIGERWAFHSVQEVDPLLDHNTAAQNHNDGYTPDHTFRRVASIPFALIEYWKTVEGWDAFDAEHADRLKAKLNDPEWRKLRTAPGKLDVKNGQLR